MSGVCIVCHYLLDKETSCFWAPNDFKDRIRVMRTIRRDEKGARSKGFSFSIKYDDDITRGPFCTVKCLDKYRLEEDDLLSLVLGAEEQIDIMRVWDYEDIVTIINQIGKEAPDSMEPRKTWKGSPIPKKKSHRQYGIKYISDSLQPNSGFGGVKHWKSNYIPLHMR